MALDSVRSHKFRSFLTVLGIVIGVMTAITIASILTGLRQNIVSIIEEYGTNNIYAFHLSTGPRTGEDRSERLRKPLTVADAEAIKAQASAVEEVGPGPRISATAAALSTTTFLIRDITTAGEHARSFGKLRRHYQHRDQRRTVHHRQRRPATSERNGHRRQRR